MKRARSTYESSSSRVSPSLEAGIIKKLRLENFMCHSNHETQFGSNVNLITGQNGSIISFPSLISFALSLYLFIFQFSIVFYDLGFVCIDLFEDIYWHKYLWHCLSQLMKIAYELWHVHKLFSTFFHKL
jgi:hypothetical protein